MESDDGEIINKTADYLDKAFFKRERLLSWLIIFSKFVII